MTAARARPRSQGRWTLAALFGAQLGHTDIAVDGAFWALFGIFQGMNPPVNRPILMAVVVPELRGQAFAIFLSVFQTIGWGRLLRRRAEALRSADRCRQGARQPAAGRSRIVPLRDIDAMITRLDEDSARQ